VLRIHTCDACKTWPIHTCDMSHLYVWLSHLTTWLIYMCDTLRHRGVSASALQHTSTHCNTLHHTATHCKHATYVNESCPTCKHIIDWSISQHDSFTCVTRYDVTCNEITWRMKYVMKYVTHIWGMSHVSFICDMCHFNILDMTYSYVRYLWDMPHSCVAYFIFIF